MAPRHPVVFAPILEPMTTHELTKGEVTRERIRAAAIGLFGDRGFDRVTTREVAAEAGVHQPVIAHYFGDKLGLYESCAQAVIDRYEQHLAPHAVAARADLAAGHCSPELARAHLARLTVDVSDFMAAGEPESAFITREMSHGGRAFDLFYDAVLSPGLELWSDLISLLHPQGGDPVRARTEALMLINCIATFDTARPTLERLFGRQPGARERHDIVVSYVNRLYG